MKYFRLDGKVPVRTNGYSLRSLTILNDFLQSLRAERPEIRLEVLSALVTAWNETPSTPQPPKPKATPKPSPHPKIGFDVNEWRKQAGGLKTITVYKLIACGAIQATIVGTRRVILTPPREFLDRDLTGEEGTATEDAPDP